MTREEAMHVVDIAFGVPQAVRRAGENRTYHEAEIRKAKEMAIKALEQEPCEDAISRQAALKLFFSDDTEYTGSEICNMIHKLPPVNPQEQKMGHWILVIEDWNKWTCSECGFSERTDIHVTLGYRFCPKCGAKMEEHS